jgi:pimeloyl-ACP methyl ester carboxylesterase
MSSADLAILSCLLLAGPALAQDAVSPRADTVPPAVVEETDFSFASGTLTLAGTLTVPRGRSTPVPVAVIIAGSGPTDRNGNSHLGPGLVYRSNSLSQLAWRLGEQGIASLRYDKRVLPATRGQVDMTTETFDNFSGDAAAAARSLQSDSRFSIVVFLGHSEGAGLAIRAANSGAPVQGVGLLAGLGRPFLAVLRSQLSAQLDSANLLAYDSAMVRYLRGDPTGPLLPGLQPLFQPAHREYIRTSAEYDPTGEVARLNVPVLIVQGSTDFQVSLEDARALHAAVPGSTLVILEGANHVFKPVREITQAAQMPSYTDPGLAIVPELPAAIKQWIDRIMRR